MRASTTPLTHLAAGTAALVLVLISSASASASASAGRAPGPEPVIDLVQAAEPVRQPETATLLNEFLFADMRRSAPQGALSQNAASRDGGSPGRLRVGRTLAVHTLNPDFVRGLRGAPPARVAAATTTVTGAYGRTATVRTAAVQGHWQVVAIASGDEEERNARAAGTDRTAFHEPQTNSWYAWSLRTDRVEPLDVTARNELGAPSLSVAAYQRLVADRYAGQLPGSAYDAEGLGGGGGPVPNRDAPLLPAVLAMLTGSALSLTAALCRPAGRPGGRTPGSQLVGSRLGKADDRPVTTDRPGE
ncbi:hypothetical protein ACGFYF_41810 [Streptomyces lavendulae]|uniref:hypothetical protein n=1 Tax=Streptomyces lavendulae TaxID=1914 RepID=UPI003711C111